MDDLTRLALAARDGDRRALGQFVRATQASIWRLCAHLVGPDDADDATQETYVAAWKALPTFRGDSSARTWLFVIARRSALRVGRRHRRWSEVGRLAVAPPPGGPPEVDDAGPVRDHLALLDDERRVAFVLTQLLGFSYAEAASICECPIGTIRSRVARARAQLVAADAARRTGTRLRRA